MWKFLCAHMNLYTRSKILQINSLLYLVGSSILFYVTDDARTNKNQVYSNGLHTMWDLVKLLKNPKCSPVYNAKLIVLPRILNYTQKGNAGWIIPQDDHWIT